MKPHDRSRRILVGISFIEEVFADILGEAQESGDSRLTTSDIRDSANQAGYDDRPGWHFCQNSLRLMETKGEVESKGIRPRKWRLVG